MLELSDENGAVFVNPYKFLAAWAREEGGSEVWLQGCEDTIHVLESPEVVIERLKEYW